MLWLNAYIKRSLTFYALPSMLTLWITNWRQNSSLTLLCNRPPYAMRAIVHTTLKATPGSLVYQRDMILNILVVADLLDITSQRQEFIDERTMAKNRERISHDYQPNDQVLVLVYKPDKLEPHAHGPYCIVHTHVNGTITIRRSPTVME